MYSTHIVMILKNNLAHLKSFEETISCVSAIIAFLYYKWYQLAPEMKFDELRNDPGFKIPNARISDIFSESNRSICICKKKSYQYFDIIIKWKPSNFKFKFRLYLQIIMKYLFCTKKLVVITFRTKVHLAILTCIN